MQLLIYFTLFLCHESFTKGKIENLNEHIKIDINDLEKYLTNLKINPNDYETNLKALYPPRSYEVKKLTQDETKHIQNKNIKDIQKYLNYAILKRRSNLHNAIEFYGTYFQSNSCNPVLVAEHYSNKMASYFNRTFHEDDAINDIDKQLVILDIVESSNSLLYKVQLNILHNETNRNNYTNSAMKKFYNLLDDLHREIRTDKEEEMKYVCEKFEVCRAFPGFSDHMSDLLGDILNYSDGNISDVLILLKILIKEKINFFRNFLDDDLIEDIGEKLTVMFGGDESELREVLSVFRKMLSRRHKFSVRKNTDRSIRAKVIRLLIDIVDKTFVKDDDAVYLMYIDMTRKSLRKLTSMTEHQMGKLFSDFIRYIINTIKYNWTPDCKKEVRTLLEVLVKNSAADKDVYEYLIKKGSQYVSTKPLSDVDII